MSSDQYEELATELDSVESTALDDRRAAQIRFFSRLGFWGVVVGMAPVAVDVLVDTWVWQVESIVTPVGVLVGGVGTLVASTLVFREVSASRKPIKWAAMAGIPLGLTLDRTRGAVPIYRADGTPGECLRPGTQGGPCTGYLPRRAAGCGICHPAGRRGDSGR